MSGRFGVRSLALLLALFAPVVGGAAPALAQYQVDAGAADAVTMSPSVLPEPFGLNVAPVTSGNVLTKWNGLVADIRAESDILTRCRENAGTCPPAAQKFLAVIAAGRGRDGRARFGIINRAVNLAIQPESDLAQWGTDDRWSAPLVTFTTGHGDCEDYAIAKYVALKEAGIGEDDLRLVIVRDLAIGQDHAVVAARLDGKWIVLDNRRLVLLEDTEMSRVLPLFVLERDGVKKFVPTEMAQGTAAGATPSSLGF
jgi:predicted transglutaminase-like cysteine proteinase